MPRSNVTSIELKVTWIVDWFARVDGQVAIAPKVPSVSASRLEFSDRHPNRHTGVAGWAFGTINMPATTAKTVLRKHAVGGDIRTHSGVHEQRYRTPSS